MTPKWPPNDPQWPPMTHQWTPSEPPMTTNDNKLGYFWFPDVEKWNFTFKFWKEPIFPEFYKPNYRINSQTRNFLEFFNKKMSECQTKAGNLEVFLRFPMFSNVFQCYLLSFSLSLTISLSHSLTLSHSHTH